jgi:hypothetical protein
MNITTLQDLRVAKMQCRYEIKLQEKAWQTGVQEMKRSTQESLKRSLQYFATELAANLVKNMILHGKRKKQ